MKPGWKGNKEYLLARLIRVLEDFVGSDKIQISPPLFNQDDIRRRLVITLNLGKVVQHMWESIIPENTESMIPVFDTERPIVSTGNMRTWYTGKLQHRVSGTPLPEGHPFHRFVAQPTGPSSPEMWVLGSSDSALNSPPTLACPTCSHIS